MKNILLVNFLAFLMLTQPMIIPEKVNVYRHEEKRSQKTPAIAMAVLMVIVLIFYGMSDPTSRKAS